MVLLIESKSHCSMLCLKLRPTRPGVKSELCCMQLQDVASSVWCLSNGGLEELPFRVLPSAFMILVNESRKCYLVQECNESQRKFGLL